MIKRIEEAFIKVRRERVPELKERLTANKENAKNLGEISFLYRDTYGLTLSTMAIVANDIGITAFILNDAILLKIYEVKMEEQKNRSRAGSKMGGDVYADKDFALNLPKTEFLGYKETQADVQVLKILNDQGKTPEARQGQVVKIILGSHTFLC